MVLRHQTKAFLRFHTNSMNKDVGLILPPTFPRQARSECPRSKVVGVCRRDNPHYCNNHTCLSAATLKSAWQQWSLPSLSVAARLHSRGRGQQTASTSGKTEYHTLHVCTQGGETMAAIQIMEIRVGAGHRQFKINLADL